MMLYPRSERRRIGLVAGSGPEAGVDLWSKIIEETKTLLAEHYLGDLDGPRVRIISSPILGMSMELERNDVAVWPELERVFDELASQTDYIAIACNTLNYYDRQLKASPRNAELISVADVVTEYLDDHGHSSVALLGAAPVTKLDRWSAYARLSDHFEIEVPTDTGALHQIIYDVKQYGGDHRDVDSRFSDLVSGLKSKTILLACTELPLVPVTVSGKEFVDVTRLLARKLVHKAFVADET